MTEQPRGDERVESTDDLWAWMNTWGDLYERHEGGLREREWVDGYRQAMRDLLARLGEMGVTDCSSAAWDRWTGRTAGLVEPGAEEEASR